MCSRGTLFLAEREVLGDWLTRQFLLLAAYCPNSKRKSVQQVGCERQPREPRWYRYWSILVTPIGEQVGHNDVGGWGIQAEGVTRPMYGWPS